MLLTKPKSAIRRIFSGLVYPKYEEPRYVSPVFLLSSIHILSGDCSILIIITDKLYMMPQAMFCMAVCDYTRVSFRRTDFTRMMADAFVLAFLLFILSAGMFGATTGMTDKINIEMLGTTLYFFIVLFTLCLQILIIFQTGLLRHTKAWYMMGIAVLVYSILGSQIYLLYESWHGCRECISGYHLSGLHCRDINCIVGSNACICRRCEFRSSFYEDKLPYRTVRRLDQQHSCGGYRG